jgi:hypothetical protein
LLKSDKNQLIFLEISLTKGGCCYMKCKIGRFIIISIVLLISLLTFIPGCTSSSQPITARLSFSESPALNSEVKVTAIFGIPKTYHDAKNVTAKIILPEGFQAISGDLEWKGNISKGGNQILNATIKAIKIGTWQIMAKAEFDPSIGEHFIGDDILYVSVSENSATISDRQPGGNIGFAIIDASQTPNPHASPIYTLPSPKSIEPGQIPTVSISPQSSSQPIPKSMVSE